MVAAKLANMAHGGDRTKASIDALSQARAAALLNVSEPSVERAKIVRDRAVPELAAKVERGEVSASLFTVSHSYTQILTSIPAASS